MKPYSALVIATISFGLFACSGNENADGRISSSSFDTNQDPTFNAEIPPWNPQRPDTNVQQSSTNPDAPPPNPDQPTGGMTCQTFCQNVSVRCAANCLEETCAFFDEAGEICIEERNALFECALTGLQCDLDGQLQDDDEVCEDEIITWLRCVDPSFDRQVPNQPDPTTDNPGTSFDGGI